MPMSGIAISYIIDQFSSLISELCHYNSNHKIICCNTAKYPTLPQSSPKWYPNQHKLKVQNMDENELNQA